MKRLRSLAISIPELTLLILIIIAAYVIMAAFSNVDSTNVLSASSVFWILLACFLLSTLIVIIAPIAGVGGGVIFTPLMLGFTSIDTMVIRATGLVVAIFIMFEDISTPAIYALDPPARTTVARQFRSGAPRMDDAELEAPPYSGDIGKGDEEWAAFPDLEYPPRSHWYLSHLGEGDGLATVGVAIGVSSVILALFVPALLCLRRKAIFFGMLALFAVIITLISMLGLLPLPD